MNFSVKTISKILDLVQQALVEKGVVPRHPDSQLMFKDFIEHPVYDDSVVKMLMFSVIYKENGSVEPEECSMLAHRVFIDYQKLLLEEFEKFQSIEDFRATDFNPFELIRSGVRYEEDEEDIKNKAS